MFIPKILHPLYAIDKLLKQIKFFKMTDIKINKEACVKCGRCARVCPPHIFMQLEKRAPIRIVRPDNCILCGHCVDVCPAKAIEHSEIPYEKVHKINYHNMPSPDQLMNLIHARRSNRTFTNVDLQESDIARIIEAGYYAPTAVNNRQVKIKLVKGQEKLNEIIEYVVDTFNELVQKMREAESNGVDNGYYNADMIAGLVKAAKRGKDPILRGAKYLLVFTSDHKMGLRDAQLAFQNCSLMAQTLGISQIYLGYVCDAYEEGDKQRLKDILEVKSEVCAVMALGVPSFRYANYTER
jgi:ferredoxin